MTRINDWMKGTGAAASALLIALAACAGSTFAQGDETPFSSRRAAVRTQDKPQPKIVGGLEIDIAQAPWQVGLVVAGVPARRGLFCGGSAFKTRWILTAAHCMFDRGRKISPAEFDVIYGTSDLTQVKNRVKVKRLIVHPDYNASTSDSDIALLELEKSVPTAFRVKLTTKTGEGRLIIPGKLVMVSGFGDLEEGAGQGSLTLQAVDLPIVSREECNAPESYDGAITDDMLCAGEKGKDSCQGDSGGPLVATLLAGRAYQIGVVSFGEGCARAKKYGVYTRVANYRKWISSLAGRL